MKAHSILLTLLSLFLTCGVRAQEDAAHQRAVYNAINEKEASLQKVKGTSGEPPEKWMLQGWADETGVRKVIARMEGEDGDGVEEYYYEEGKPVFVFRRYSQQEGKKTVKVEDRFYFKNGKLSQWLDTQKKAIDPKEENFAAEAQRLSSNAATFLKALKVRGGAAKAPAAAAAKAVEGTFLGVEQGDYLHWNMKTAAGEEASYFILKPDKSMDKVLEAPKGFLGKKCRVQVKTSTENIPEAGGKMEVTQVLSVEWIGKK